MFCPSRCISFGHQILMLPSESVLYEVTMKTTRSLRIAQTRDEYSTGQSTYRFQSGSGRQGVKERTSAYQRCQSV